MLAYKFLDTNWRAPVTGARWEPGVWVTASHAEPCVEGVHACLADDVAYWFAPTMWRIELDGDVVRARRKVVAMRGRLVDQVAGYDDAMRELHEVSAWRCRDRAVGALRHAGREDDARRFESAREIGELVVLAGSTDEQTYAGRAAAFATDAAHQVASQHVAATPFVAACSAGHDACGPGGDQAAFDAGYEAERAYQSRWLTARLAL